MENSSNSIKDETESKKEQEDEEVVQNLIKQGKYDELLKYLNAKPLDIDIKDKDNEDFKPFDQSKITINDRVKPTKWKKIINILVPVVIFAFWGVFLGWGIVNVGEFLYLFHAEIFFSFKKIIDVKILFVLICLYYHICFYILMGLYTWRVKYKNKKSIK